MTIAAHTKTWQFDVNITLAALASAPNEAAQMIVRLKNGLVGFAQSPWAMHYSCDSVVAGSDGDGIDRITDHLTDWVLATADTGTIRSWFVLRNAVTSMEVLFEARVSATNNGRAFRWVVSPAAGFTGGTTTQRPTATDERVVLAGAANEVVGLGGSSNTTSRAYRLHIWHSNDGEFTMWAICHNGNMTGWGFLGIPENPVTGWTTPRIWGWLATQTDAPVNLGDHSFWLDQVLTSVVTVNRFYGNFTPAGNGGAAFTFSMPCYGNPSGTASDRTCTVETRTAGTDGVNQISNEFEAPRPGIFCNVSGSRGTHGRLFDVRLSHESAQLLGDRYPTSAPFTWVKVGALWLPWNDTTFQST